MGSWLSSLPLMIHMSKPVSRIMLGRSTSSRFWVIWQVSVARSRMLRTERTSPANRDALAWGSAHKNATAADKKKNLLANSDLLFASTLSLAAQSGTFPAEPPCAAARVVPWGTSPRTSPRSHPWAGILDSPELSPDWRRKATAEATTIAEQFWRWGGSCRGLSPDRTSPHFYYYSR